MRKGTKYLPFAKLYFCISLDMRGTFQFIGDTNITVHDFLTLQQKNPVQNSVE